MNTYNKDYYKRNSERIIKNNLNYYYRNRIDRLEYMKAYNKEYYQKNKIRWIIRSNNIKEDQKNKKKIIKEVPKEKPNFIISFT
jgi:hypothetical protein